MGVDVESIRSGEMIYALCERKSMVSRLSFFKFHILFRGAIMGE